MRELTITITPTQQLADLDGVLCRVWAGVTGGGHKVRVMVRAVGVDAGDEAANAELFGPLLELPVEKCREVKLS